jgi:hypothetical protein
MHRPFREAEPGRELADAEPARACRERPENAGRTIDRLNHRNAIVEWRSTL